MEEIEENIVIQNLNNTYDPEYTLIATFNSITDANQFCNTYNHNNMYNNLKLAQRIQINDGTYNLAWIIVGFDCERNQTAADGSTYDNGYGICLMPENNNGVFPYAWNENINSPTPYIQSTMHTSTLPTIANNLKNVLGNHLINRNVLLGSGASPNQDVGTTSYTWTTAYCTLPSIGQLGGDFGIYNTFYDDGEANYRLPGTKNLYLWGRDNSNSKTCWTRNYNGMHKDINSEQLYSSAYYYTIFARDSSSIGNIRYYHTSGYMMPRITYPFIIIR